MKRVNTPAVYFKPDWSLSTLCPLARFDQLQIHF